MLLAIAQEQSPNFTEVSTMSRKKRQLSPIEEPAIEQNTEKQDPTLEIEHSRNVEESSTEQQEELVEINLIDPAKKPKKVKSVSEVKEDSAAKKLKKRKGRLSPIELREAESDYYLGREQAELERNAILESLKEAILVFQEAQAADSKEQKTIFRGLRKVMTALKDDQEKKQLKLLQKISKSLDSLEEKMDTLITLQSSDN